MRQPWDLEKSLFFVEFFIPFSCFFSFTLRTLCLKKISTFDNYLKFCCFVFLHLVQDLRDFWIFFWSRGKKQAKNDFDIQDRCPFLGQVLKRDVVRIVSGAPAEVPRFTSRRSIVYYNVIILFLLKPFSRSNNPFSTQYVTNRYRPHCISFTS